VSESTLKKNGGLFLKMKKTNKKKTLKCLSEWLCVQDRCFREGCDDEKAAGGRYPEQTKDLPGL